MRLEGSIESIERIENNIKEKRVFTIAHNANKEGPLFGGDFESDLYTIVYEIYLDKKAKRYIENRSIKLLSCKSFCVRFRYDKRNDTAEIKMRKEFIDRITDKDVLLPVYSRLQDSRAGA